MLYKIFLFIIIIFLTYNNKKMNKNIIIFELILKKNKIISFNIF
jgi:hypothetical protein